MTPNRADGQKDRDRSAAQGEKAQQRKQDAGRTPQPQAAPPKGERPIADVDRKVRGGDA